MQVGSSSRWQGTIWHLCFGRMTKDHVMVEYGLLEVSQPQKKACIQKLDAKIDEYEISLGDESEAFFTLFRLVE